MPYSFKDQVASDAAAQISIDEWGEAAVYVHPNGTETPIVTVFHGDQSEVKDAKDGGVLANVTIFEILNSEVSEPLINAVIRYSGKSWTITGIASKDTAVTQVICDMPSVSDRGRHDYRTGRESPTYRRR